MDLETISVRLTADVADFVRGMGRAEGAINDLEHEAQTSSSRISSFLQDAFSFATGGAILEGVQALGSGMVGLAKDGLTLNSTLEDTRAQLLAMTKDGAKADAILADIREEASQTPFGFLEMAKATASLLPAAKQSGVALDDLIKQAEILAASNPAEGLEGAAFSLKEALSGDFGSIVERFNLPRQELARLKDEGVPAVEAIRQVMAGMGLDASLVAGMAETMTGRWSTFLDTLDTLKASMAQPLFDVLKEGLVDVQGFLDANTERLTAFATTLGTYVAGAVTSSVGAMQAAWGALAPVLATVGEMARDVAGDFAAAGLGGALARVAEMVSGFVPTAALLVPILGAVGDIATSLYNAVWKLAEGFYYLGGPAAQEIIKFVTTGEASFGAFKALLSVVTGVSEQTFGDIVGAVQRALPQFVAVLSRWADAAWAWLQEAAPKIVAAAGAALGALVGYVEQQRPAWTATLLEWGEAAYEWLGAAIPPLLQEAGRLVSSLLGYLADSLPGWIATLLEWGAAAWEWIGDAIPPLLKEAGRLLTELVKWAISEGLPALVKTAGEWAKALYVWIDEKLIPEIKPGLMRFLKSFGDYQETMQKTFTDFAKGLAGALLDGLVNAIKAGAGRIGEAIKDLVGSIPPINLGFGQGQAQGQAQSRASAPSGAGRIAAASPGTGGGGLFSGVLSSITKELDAVATATAATLGPSGTMVATLTSGGAAATTAASDTAGAVGQEFGRLPGEMVPTIDRVFGVPDGAIIAAMRDNMSASVEITSFLVDETAGEFARLAEEIAPTLGAVFGVPNGLIIASIRDNMSASTEIASFVVASIVYEFSQLGTKLAPVLAAVFGPGGQIAQAVQGAAAAAQATASAASMGQRGAAASARAASAVSTTSARAGVSLTVAPKITNTFALDLSEAKIASIQQKYTKIMVDGMAEELERMMR